MTVADRTRSFDRSLEMLLSEELARAHIRELHRAADGPARALQREAVLVAGVRRRRTRRLRASLRTRLALG